MKSRHESVKPDHQLPADIIYNNKKIATVNCLLWLPQHRQERPYLRFESNKPEDREIGDLSPFYDLEMNLIVNGEKEVQIKCKRVLIDKFTMSHYSTDVPPKISFEGHPEELVRDLYHVSTENKDNPGSDLWVYLTENSFLNPSYLIERHYSGSVEIETVNKKCISVPGLGKANFYRHHYWIDLEGNGKAVYSKLAAEIRQIEDESIAAGCINLSEFRNILLFSSLAANQQTLVTGWKRKSKNIVTEKWYGNLNIDEKFHLNTCDRDNWLIQLSWFEEFIKCTLEKFYTYPAWKREIIEEVIQKIVSPQKSYQSNRFLDLFSALESILLIFRKENGLELTIGKNWSKMEKKIRSLVNGNASLFESKDHVGFFKNMLPSLKRVSLQDAWNEFVSKTEMDDTDLWPLFGGKGATLSDIRNKIIHGDSILSEENYEAVFRATQYLEVYAKRALLITLSWDLSKSNVSKSQAIDISWISTELLNSYRKELAV